MRKILLVEGTGDKDFFTALLQQVFKLLQSEFTIQILVPTDLGADKDGKEQVKKILAKNINREYKNEDVFLGCILDADYFHNTGNPESILEGLLKKIPSEAGYKTIVRHETSGYYFKSDNEYNNIGIWFMPNNKDEGMLENWLLKIAKSDENDLIQYADTVCKQAPEIRFDQKKDFAKAQVTVWTAL